MLIGQRDPEVQTRLDQSRLEAHCLGELRRRAGGVAVLAEFQTKAEMGLGKVGLQADGFRVMSLGFGTPSELDQSQAEVDMGFRIGGKKAEGIVRY